jgi:hypothetical protein
MLKKIAFLLLLIIPISSFSSDFIPINGISISGIWQNTSTTPEHMKAWQAGSLEKQYYSIQRNENMILLIDLAQLETNGDIFSASYIGEITYSGKTNEGYLVEQYYTYPLTMVPHTILGEAQNWPLSITFKSDKEAYIVPYLEESMWQLTGIDIKKVW